jgi:hypothetical protein
VNGAGSKYSRAGSRYAPKLAETVYLAEELETCFAEKMFYFHRETLTALDAIPALPKLPFFQRPSILWEVKFATDVPDILDLSDQANSTAFSVFQSLMLNPSQDFDHLKDKRTEIQATRDYRGLRAPSSRSKTGGHMIVLFESQERNVAEIIPHDIEIRLIREDTKPFLDPFHDWMDYRAADVRIIPNTEWQFPATGNAYQTWRRLEFNH